MARSRDQRSVKNDSAATRASAHKLGRPVSTWSTVRHQFQKARHALAFFTAHEGPTGAGFRRR